jgi:hypothetical protein
MSEKKRGGPGRGQGRKPLKHGEETVTLSLRVTAEQREKLRRLGGARWVRERIDCASDASLGAPRELVHCCDDV